MREGRGRKTMEAKRSGRGNYKLDLTERANKWGQQFRAPSIKKKGKKSKEVK